MSTYLSRLIDRTQGRAAALQRRRPALFEPAVPWTGSMTAHTTASQDAAFERYASMTASRETNASDPDTHLTGSPVPTMRPAPDRQAMPGVPVNLAVSADARRSQAQRASPLAEMPTDGSPVNDAGAPARTHPDSQPARTRTPFVDATSRENAERDARVRLREARSAMFPSGHDSWLKSQLDSPSLATPPAASSQASHARIEDGSPALPRAVVTAPRPIDPLARTTVARASFQQGLPRQAQTAAAATSASPTVQITIGRVEVRAISEPVRSGPRSSQAASPRLTLDDYLRTRGGTRR